VGDQPAHDHLIEVADQLHSSALHLIRMLRRHDAVMELPPARASALSVVVFGGPLPMGQLADLEQVRSPTMTRIVHQLERDGLVRRRVSPEDGRSLLVEATGEGRKLMAAGRAKRIEALADRIGDLSATEIALLARAADLLNRLSRHPGQGK
jgi:DNA-binding MarR family transcriptional regulator